jgi:hypothetical protein
MATSFHILSNSSFGNQPTTGGYRAGLTEFSDDWRCIWQFSEFWELQTDVDQMAKRFQYMLLMRHISLCGINTFSTDHTNGSKWSHATCQPQFSHIYFTA